ncbi:bone morphogenetic protein 5-like [Limulus polyphemus]|uniref:Bone morphogenetic protein 5-like n=1 Tax=Limulus polyphemus TaxID=6850 RepID=A0ABM1SSN2_LIMPO|nr:bone morphogenetic protein 5-like [Limulus polyphemus]
MTKRCVRPAQALLLLCCVTMLVKTQPLSVETDDLPVREPRNKDDLDYIELEEEIERIKQHILSELGMESAPDSSQVNVTQSELDRVMEIYHRNTRNSIIQEALEEDKDNVVHKSYTFRDEAPLQFNFSDDFAQSRGLQTIFFPLDFSDHATNNTRGLTVDSAKLSVYKVRKGVHHQAVGRIGRSDAASNSEEPKEATVFIYQLQEPLHLKDPERLLVTAQQVLLDTDGWEVFDVAKAVETWVESPALNFGLHIECSECETFDFTFISMNSTELPNQFLSRNYKKGALLSYQAPGRAVLDIELIESSARIKRSKPNTGKRRMKYPFDCTSGKKTKLCCRYSMNVSFEELEWNWILKPKHFEAYFCKGKCVRNGKNYASNHAIIQNLMRKKKNRRKKIPRPCCAPKKMKPLDIVYFKNKSEVDTKQLRGMIVSQCSCA